MNPILLDFPHEFETERLVIRCPLPGDGTMVYEAMVESHAEVRKWMPWAINLPVVEEVEENVRRAHINFILREDLRLHLFLKASGRFVGSTGLHRINWDVRRFEIGYWIRTAESGRGLATEAVHGLVRWASEYLNARRLEIRCDARNLRSRKVAERAGFHLEAVLRQEEPGVDGLPRDSVIYVKLRLPSGEWGYPS
ncbi:GNAT family N-acetyltransferase [Sulfobacillus thermosulfidooxidans]|uniref:GNAT family N-acetyltransferase n=1 Tax=Sulfobacillus thermosulfidooxidans TaxID=28034 RepID=UPI00096BA8F4|nr:GNAT family N-acetyltransferase [Sulfobacillus thermosulfidooxidans]OLZ12011.1 GNAT family N-acetyltransferase [Sulfobacillus thermosulfidooxidans]OLZ16737.1 GNAT family N-acetyltransferase [Sulfobacillus thermosulfidooxidans]OLZ20714.1 GNAT family N-acetyltransferase [Sulfobacillus thermosulfidooxidans]